MKDKITIKKPKTNSAVTYHYNSKVTKALKQVFLGLLQAAYIRKEEADRLL
jgi:hypothetical protein